MRISDWSSDVCSSDLPPSPSGEEQRDLRACSLVAAGWAIRISFITAPAISAPAAPAAPASPPPAPRPPPLRRPPRASAPRAARPGNARTAPPARSEEHTSELQSLMRISYAVFCLKKKNKHEAQVY